MIRKLWIALIMIGVLFMGGWQSGDYSTPEAIFETYKKALAIADTETYLNCVTKSSQDMLSQRHPQPSLMRREYQDIADKDYKVTIKDGTAILEFVPTSKIAPPYLFKKEDGKWKIDLRRMNEEIVFDEKNHWHWR